jgi:endonuclease/exonuclease/phosphatase family metal-dependent hydrolase
MARLRCLSFNIWKNEGDYPRRMSAIAALLREIQPDVVALQECFVAAELQIDSARTVAGTGYHLTRYPARAKLRLHEGAWMDSRSDMVILSRLSPLAQGRVALPCDPRDGERGLLWGDLPIAGGVRVGCIHLTHLRDATAQGVRVQQAAAVMAALRSTPAPAILMGDFNAPANDPTLEAIFDHPVLCPTARDFSKAPAGDEAPGNGAIDHVLLFASPEQGRMVSRRIVAAPDLSGHPSDHPAILADIEIF